GESLLLSFASSRGGPLLIHARMASTFSSGDAASGTTASEKPLKYFRTEYSRAPVAIVHSIATNNSRLMSHHTTRNTRCSFPALWPFIRHCSLGLAEDRQFNIKRFHLLERSLPAQPFHRRGATQLQSPVKFLVL